MMEKDILTELALRYKELTEQLMRASNSAVTEKLAREREEVFCQILEFARPLRATFGAPPFRRFSREADQQDHEARLNQALLLALTNYDPERNVAFSTLLARYFRTVVCTAARAAQKKPSILFVDPDDDHSELFSQCDADVIAHIKTFKVPVPSTMTDFLSTCAEKNIPVRKIESEYVLQVLRVFVPYNQKVLTTPDGELYVSVFGYLSHRQCSARRLARICDYLVGKTQVATVLFREQSFLAVLNGGTFDIPEASKINLLTL